MPDPPPTGCWKLHERVLKLARRGKRHGRDAWWSDLRDPGRQRNRRLLHLRHGQLPHSLRGSVREHHDGVYPVLSQTGSGARKNLCPSMQVAGVGWPVPGSSPYCVTAGNGLLGTNVRACYVSDSLGGRVSLFLTRPGHPPESSGYHPRAKRERFAYRRWRKASVIDCYRYPAAVSVSCVIAWYRFFSSTLRQLWPNGTITATSMGGFSSPYAINNVSDTYPGGGYMIADGGNNVIKQV